MSAEQAKINFGYLKQALSKQRQGLSIHKDPVARNTSLKETLKGDGIPVDTVENPHGAYCALSLTNTPDKFKPKLKE